MESLDWMSQSLCRHKNNNLWYPPLDSDSPEKYYAVAREVCRQCPVWSKCLALGTTEKWGMWGGLTPNERTVLVDSQPRQTSLRPHGTWLRYRQGCRCDDCIDVSGKPNKKINTNLIPKMHQDLGDLDVLKFLLIDD